MERRKFICRYLVALFCHDFLWESEQLSNLNISYANYLFGLIEKEDSAILDCLGSMTKEEFLRPVETLQNTIALVVLMGDQVHISHEVILCISILDFFHRSNVKKHRINKKEFVNEACSNSLNLNILATNYYNFKNKPKNAQRPFLILDYPWLFSTEAKVDVLQVENLCS